jgi:hypothetical protein
MPSGSAFTKQPPPEVELVLLLSNPLLGDDGAKRARQLGAQLLDWNQVFGMLVMHRTLALAWKNIVDHELGSPQDFKPEYVLPMLEVFAKGQAALAHEHVMFSSEIAQALEQAGIGNVVLKGPALAMLAYGDLGMRISNDTDILIHRADLTRAHRVMHQLGYMQGTWDFSQHTVVPASRQQIIQHTIYSHETFPYVVPAPGSRMMERHQVDMHFSVDIDTANSTDAVVSDMLSQRIPIEPSPESRFWSVNQEDMFVFVCVNFAREARLRTETVELVDLVLYKLVDVLGLLGNRTYPLDETRVLARVAQLGMAQEVYFALHHLAELFPGHAPLELMEALRPDSVSYIDEVQDFAAPPNTAQARWHSYSSPIIDRFFNTWRLLELVDESDLLAEPFR